MTNIELLAKACNSFPGGVNSPVRSFSSVGGDPVFIESGEGPYVFDINGKKYIDYVGSWGAALLGHAHPSVVDAVCKTAAKGLGFGAPSRLEVELADTIHMFLPWIEKMRMVSSGTEACMSAIRLARGYTARSIIIKFEGCYHGHTDCLLVKAGSGALTHGTPSSSGVPVGTTSDTLVLPYNCTKSLERAFSDYSGRIAAVIVEPIAGNMNMVPGRDDFLRKIRECCSSSGSVMIFDEVMSGFRVAAGGAASLYNIEPDLACYGKVIGGGLPVAIFAGKKEIMDYLAPLGDVYQAGTLSGNPVALAAGLAGLKVIASDTGIYKKLEVMTLNLLNNISDIAKASGVGFQYRACGAMFGFFFSEDSNIESFYQVMACNQPLFNSFFHFMFEKGVYFAPSSFEAGFISMAHSEVETEKTLELATEYFSKRLFEKTND